MAKTILIDMDNTLIETQALYEDAHTELARVILGAGPFEEADVIAALREEEASLFSVYGYGKDLLPHAFANTLRRYVPDASAAEEAAARDIAWNVYRREAAEKPGAADAIRLLSREHTICLVTVGDEDVQRKRIERLSCKDDFHAIYVVAEKNASTYTRILAEVGTAPCDAIMIGDSLRSDILPALEAGLEAIFIPAGNWQAREMHGATLPERGVLRLADILAAAEEVCSRRRNAEKPPVPGPGLK